MGQGKKKKDDDTLTLEAQRERERERDESNDLLRENQENMQKEKTKELTQIGYNPNGQSVLKVK